ncbi:MAG: hypothetical protein ACKVOR_11735, partial [Flavobacteriales bacterium]
KAFYVFDEEFHLEGRKFRTVLRLLLIFCQYENQLFLSYLYNKCERTTLTSMQFLNLLPFYNMAPKILCIAAASFMARGKCYAQDSIVIESGIVFKNNSLGVLFNTPILNWRGYETYGPIIWLQYSRKRSEKQRFNFSAGYWQVNFDKMYSWSSNSGNSTTQHLEQTTYYFETNTGISFSEFSKKKGAVYNATLLIGYEQNLALSSMKKQSANSLVEAPWQVDYHSMKELLNVGLAFNLGYRFGIGNHIETTVSTAPVFFYPILLKEEIFYGESQRSPEKIEFRWRLFQLGANFHF